MLRQFLLWKTHGKFRPGDLEKHHVLTDSEMLEATNWTAWEYASYKFEPCMLKICQTERFL